MLNPGELLDDTQEYVRKRSDKFTPEQRAKIRIDRKLQARKARRKKAEAEAEERERLEAERKHQKYNDYYRKYMKKWRAERKAKRIAEIRKKAAEESLLGNKY